MLLKTKVNNFNVDIRFDHPTHTDWIFGSFFKEFLITVTSNAHKREEDIEKTKSLLIKAFEVFADYRSLDREGNEYIFAFRFKESIGIPIVEFFETLVRRQAEWVLKALNQSIDCEKYRCKVEIVLDSTFAESNLMQ